MNFFSIENELFLQILIYVTLFSHIFFTILLGIYLITNLQWYNYKITRVFFKHHKKSWHYMFFIIPILAYLTTENFFWAFFYFIYVPLFFKWIKKIDTKLVITSRVKRFFTYLFVSSIFFHIYSFLNNIQNGEIFTIFSLAISVFAMNFSEKIVFLKYKKQAKSKLEKMNNLQIIQITASFGKTSIKNFIYELLSKKYNVYNTPKSVNTINGIVKDINNNLPINTQIYIVESGARVRGDILEITNLLKPQTVVLGKIGLSHLEYFKTIENIINTKLEILQSARLKKAYVCKYNIFEKNIKENISKLPIWFYPNELEIIKSNLNQTDFYLNIGDEKHKFTTKILGKLNPQNISVAIDIAREFNISIEDIKQSVQNLSFVPHRLERIQNPTKIILDDSYNSNLDGMLSAIELSSNHKGAKIIVTCGIVESDEKSNIIIAKAIDEVFNIVIITSKLNQKILDKNIKKAQKFILEDKTKIHKLLSSLSHNGDLVLFANDAPNYI